MLLFCDCVKVKLSTCLGINIIYQNRVDAASIAQKTGFRKISRKSTEKKGFFHFQIMFTGETEATALVPLNSVSGIPPIQFNMGNSQNVDFIT